MRINSSGLFRYPITVGCILLGGLISCQTPPQQAMQETTAPATPSRSRNPRLVQNLDQIPRLDGPEPTEPVGPVATTQPGSQLNFEDIQKQIPGPDLALQRANQYVAKTDSGTDKKFAEAVMERVNSIRRPKQVRLSLRDCVRMALQNNYAVRAAGYGPAIEATRIVEAEARFDSVFFMGFTSNRQDRPSSSQLQGTTSDTRTYEGGIRKLLSTGTQIQASYGTSRSASDLVFQTLNPAWMNQLILEAKQPLLRGFGLDYNRSQIEMYKLDRKINMEQFKKNLQEMIFNVEQSYWQLKRVRADMVTLAVLLADFERIDRFLEARKGFDTYPIQRGQVRSRLESRKTEFVALRASVFTAEDTLKAFINDSSLTLANDVEIVPADEFDTVPLLMDRLGEVQAALDNRSELSEAQWMIEKTRVAIGVAKNQALPKFDIVFRYIVDGLGGHWYKALDQLSENRFNEYYVGLEFEYPIGSRGAEAAIRRARLQEAQAISNHAAQIEKIIAEVHVAVRDVETAYEQISSSLVATQATADEVQATRERQLARDPANLEVELSALERLASARNALSNTLLNYNVSLVKLEQKKGTLLKYNNIELRDPEATKPMGAQFVPVDPDKAH